MRGRRQASQGRRHQRAALGRDARLRRKAVLFSRSDLFIVQPNAPAKIGWSIKSAEQLTEAACLALVGTSPACRKT